MSLARWAGARVTRSSSLIIPRAPRAGPLAGPPSQQQMTIQSSAAGAEGVAAGALRRGPDRRVGFPTRPPFNSRLRAVVPVLRSRAILAPRQRMAPAVLGSLA